jgi:hypothetical protein
VAVDSIGRQKVGAVVAVEVEVDEDVVGIMEDRVVEDTLLVVVGRELGIGIMMLRELGERKRMIRACITLIDVRRGFARSLGGK